MIVLPCSIAKYSCVRASSQSHLCGCLQRSSQRWYARTADAARHYHDMKGFGFGGIGYAARARIGTNTCSGALAGRAGTLPK